MDRERLKDVKQTDLTEGRINEDFLDWLKTKGTSWLLVAVIALFAYAAFVRWKNSRMNHQTAAWTELSQAALPSSLEEVADKYTDVGAVSQLARLRAAGRLLGAVQADKTLAAENETAAPLTDELKTEYLDRSDRLYAQLVESDDGSNRMALIVASALNGRAAVAESKGQLEEARGFYSSAAERVRSEFPTLAAQATAKAESVDRLSTPTTLITRAELTILQQAQISPSTLEPVWSEPWLNDLLSPQP